ncbi:MULTISPECIES: hypothetical protein [Xanthomonas]|nr:MULTISPECIES: hypothetical protein [Xanthomonas]MBO9748653.1 hypothetical protein [Xanthomonas phaseoli pv. dieffenbachiae]MBO9753182.1 hypothetical protein [Xanthomonas phaseoli pv. dieffenbachiae]MBO9877133.1 hypothetical protein [Xanthomonas sp. D-99]MBO9889932.1 hypothetical protein [Xanthomonas sp. D-36-1]MCT8356976.1 hypothetical protein [Xanthomonas citri pv. anacardii]
MSGLLPGSLSARMPMGAGAPMRIDANDFIHRSIIANGARAADLGIGMAR